MTPSIAPPRNSHDVPGVLHKGLSPERCKRRTSMLRRGEIQIGLMVVDGSLHRSEQLSQKEDQHILPQFTSFHIFRE